MSKYLAHASHDENGKLKGGKAGDQTGGEVCVRTWYKRPWNAIFRLLDKNLRIPFANNMIDIAKNDNIGYDQSGRNTLKKYALEVSFDFKKIKTKCECDCSSMVTNALLGAIYQVYGKEAYEKAYKKLYEDGNACTTSTMRTRLKNAGLIDNSSIYTSSAYVNGTSKLEFGDILIYETHHVACYVDDGKKKTVVNGETYPGPWPKLPKRGYFVNGDIDDEVKKLKGFLNWYVGSALNVNNPNYFSKTEDAVEKFQAKTKLVVDGQFGPKSLAKAKEVTK